MGMYRTLDVKSWVHAADGCPIRHNAGRAPGESVTFTFGTGPDEFEFGFDTESLREFLKVGTEALRQVESAGQSN